MKHTVPPISENGSNIHQRRFDRVLLSFGQSLDFLQHVPEVETPAHVIDIWQNIHSLNQSTSQSGIALARGNRPIKGEVEETLEGCCGEHKALVFVPHKDNVGERLAGLFKPFQVEKTLAQGVAYRNACFEVQVELRLKQQPDVRPLRVTVCPVWGSEDCFGALLADCLPVGVLDIFFDTGSVQRVFHEWSSF